MNNSIHWCELLGLFSYKRLDHLFIWFAANYMFNFILLQRIAKCLNMSKKKFRNATEVLNVQAQGLLSFVLMSLCLLKILFKKWNADNKKYMEEMHAAKRKHMEAMLVKH